MRVRYTLFQNYLEIYGRKNLTKKQITNTQYTNKYNIMQLMFYTVLKKKKKKISVYIL